MTDRRLRFQLSPTRSVDDKLAFELGVKIGYWPCLKAPFISLAVGYKRLDFWYGLPSQWEKGKSQPEFAGIPVVIDERMPPGAIGIVDYAALVQAKLDLEKRIREFEYKMRDEIYEP